MPSLDLCDVTTRAVTVSGAEVLQLKSLAVVVDALANKFDPGDWAAKRQLTALNKNLLTIIMKLEGMP